MKLPTPFTPARHTFADLLLLLVLALAFVGSAHAKPSAPDVFCGAYPDAPLCKGQNVYCSTCHAGPPNLNPYGVSVVIALSNAGWDNVSDSQFAQLLPTAVLASSVEGSDADGDGLTNLEEIELGLMPGDARSHWVAPPDPTGPDNPFFAVGDYDPVFRLQPRRHRLLRSVAELRRARGVQERARSGSLVARGTR